MLKNSLRVIGITAVICFCYFSAAANKKTPDPKIIAMAVEKTNNLLK